ACRPADAAVHPPLFRIRALSSGDRNRSGLGRVEPRSAARRRARLSRRSNTPPRGASGAARAAVPAARWRRRATARAPRHRNAAIAPATGTRLVIGRIRARVANMWDRARTLGELGWLLFLRDFRIRFRQTFFGSLWAIAQVLLSYLPLVFVGSQIGLAGDRDPRRYALHSLLGLLIWQMFWDGLFSPQWIGRRMRGLLSETAFPPESILVAGASYAFYNAAIYVVVILAAFPM